MNRNISRISQQLVGLPRSVKQIIAASGDASLCVLAVGLAFYLRLGAVDVASNSFQLVVLLAAALAVPLFWSMGLYRVIFRYSGLPTLITVGKAVAIYTAVFSLIVAGIGIDGVPPRVGLIQPILVLILVGASRVLARLLLDRTGLQRGKKVLAARAIIYGAGNAGRQLAQAMANSPEVRVVGFVDDDESLHGHVLNGLSIYSPTDLSYLQTHLNVTDVLLALPSVTRNRRNDILASLAHLHVTVRTLPELSDIATGRVKFSDIRDLDINDLLGREPVAPNGVLLNRDTRSKTVLVTGAGGSIGSELCRQILRCQPQRLLLVEMSEFALYQIDSELRGLQADSDINAELIPLLASVCDEKRMTDIMQAWKPDTVYHAAAYKHVPLVEHNPAEGIRNNVWGTMVCAQAAAKAGVSQFVLVSTDKAVRPTNIMGATKRLAEMVLQALAASQTGTTFSMVRFGNVLGSSGSVVPLFRQQIRAGGPITLTHLDITRYFMTIPEAAQLVIQAGAMGGAGDVFVLDMGQPVRIVDLASRMVELSGLVVKDERHPDGDIEIQVTGLRPGEKLYEELLIGDNPEGTQHPRIMKARENFLAWNLLQEELTDLQAAMQNNDLVAMRSKLKRLVQGYQPADSVVDWVHVAQQAERQTLQTKLALVANAKQP